jgi:hypothetical protein
VQARLAAVTLGMIAAFAAAWCLVVPYTTTVLATTSSCAPAIVWSFDRPKPTPTNDQGGPLTDAPPTTHDLCQPGAVPRLFSGVLLGLFAIVLPVVIFGMTSPPEPRHYPWPPGPLPPR